MFNFIIVLKEPGLQFTLGYKDEGAAKSARENIHARRKLYFSDPKEDGVVTVKDDFGHHLDVMASNIAAVLIQDQYCATERDQEQYIDKARFNEAFLKRRKEDMELMRLFPGQNQIMPTGRA